LGGGEKSRVLGFVVASWTIVAIAGQARAASDPDDLGGDWEGKLTAFYPDAVSSELVPRAPTEFADVVAGK
jgi:hypothetical protein